eukprot:TRINITY_DN90439_c0_g1_i1.p1 TRINITY_DN90439_c0_g1~~TRINITY_DN90439_c0_g1_i1.p1  ORF type:complete len:798 (+),score=174.05 TRINITY_DN90439_c0_g1_i1:68-2461(+)
MELARAIGSWKSLEGCSPAKESRTTESGSSLAMMRELFVAQPLQASSGSEAVTAKSKTAAFVLVSQGLDSFPNMVCSQVTIKASVFAPAEGTTLTFKIEVPGYDCEKSGHFQQILVGAGCRALLLVAPRCCAAVALPDLTDTTTKSSELRAVPLVPPGDAQFLKVMWHPLSDAHIGALLSDETWQLLNLAHRASVTEPEVHFPVVFSKGLDAKERVVDFTFNPLYSESGGLVTNSPGEAAWLAMSVLFLSSAGRLCFRSPVLPSTSWLPAAAFEALRFAAECTEGAASEEQEWLQRTFSSSCVRRDVGDRTLVCVKHGLHLHDLGDVYHNRWLPDEQLLVEDNPQDTGDGPRSPVHKSSSYCSVQVVAYSPAVVVARSTTSGLVEVLIVDSPLGPKFRQQASGLEASSHEAVTCSIFDEIDLAVSSGSSKASAFSLSTAAVQDACSLVLIARSRGLVAAIEFPWIAALRNNAEASLTSLPAASVTTLSELRDGPGDIVGWQMVGSTPGGEVMSAGLALRTLEGRAGGAAAGCTLNTVDVKQVLKSAAAKAQASRPAEKESGSAQSRPPAAASASAPERAEYLKQISAPVLLPAPLFGSASSSGAGRQAAAVAKAVSAVHTGQLADLAARGEILQHLSTQVPKRAAAVQSEVKDLRRSADELKQRSDESQKKAERLKERQQGLEKQYAAVVAALAAELEVRELDGVAAEDLPRLWTQLHDLRHAFDLLRAASAPADRSPDGSDELPASARQLATIEELQRTWTGAAAAGLRAQAAEVEAAVVAAERRMSHQRRSGAAS